LVNSLLDVGSRSGGGSHSSGGDDVQGTVGGPISASIESVPLSLTRSSGDGTGPTQRREAGFRAQPLRVVSGGNEQLGGGGIAEGVSCYQLRNDLVMQFQVATGQGLERDPVGRNHTAVVGDIRSPGGECPDQLHPRERCPRVTDRSKERQQLVVGRSVGQETPEPSRPRISHGRSIAVRVNLTQEHLTFAWHWML